MTLVDPRIDPEPVTYYDKEDDFATILIFSGEVEVEQISKDLSLFARPRTEMGLTYVGCYLRGVREFCKKHGMPCHGEVSITDIMNKVAEKDPAPRTVAAIRDVVLPLFRDFPISKTVVLP